MRCRKLPVATLDMNYQKEIGTLSKEIRNDTCDTCHSWQQKHLPVVKTSFQPALQPLAWGPAAIRPVNYIEYMLILLLYPLLSGQSKIGYQVTDLFPGTIDTR